MKSQTNLIHPALQTTKNGTTAVKKGPKMAQKGQQCLTMGLQGPIQVASRSFFTTNDPMVLYMDFHCNSTICTIFPLNIWAIDILRLLRILKQNYVFLRTITYFFNNNPSNPTGYC